MPSRRSSGARHARAIPVTRAWCALAALAATLAPGCASDPDAPTGGSLGGQGTDRSTGGVVTSGGTADSGGTPPGGSTGSGGASGGRGGVIADTGGVAPATGGEVTGTGGLVPTGGTVVGTGGADGTGGVSTGGVSTGGVSTGGADTGGDSTGGAPTGGLSTGGVSTGGADTGGVSTGGAPTGGLSTGGVSTGGAPTGGLNTGGDDTGGAPTGGISTGGADTGGAPSGGVSTGGTPGTTPSTGCGKTPTLSSGEHDLGGRRYIIRIPDDYDPNQPYKLVFGMHWMGGHMEDVDTGQTVSRNVWSYYGLQQLDTEHTAIFVAPEGNACGTWCRDDMSFVDDMVELFEQELCIDTGRIFSVGFSYGAIFTYSLACDRPNIFRAVATLAAAPNIGCQDGSQPVAYLGITGMSDPLCTPTMGRGCRDTFVEANGCEVPASVPEWTSGQNHVCYSYEGCDDGYPVRWCTGNFTHKAAPCDTCCPDCDDGATTWAPREVWDFFSQF